MLRNILGEKVFVSVISHKRPENMAPLQKIIGDFTVFVNEGEGRTYGGGNWGVVQCGRDICEARNMAIERAGKYPCIQVSDDLKRIQLVDISRGGKRTVRDVTFEDVVHEMVNELARVRYLYGGVAVTNNRLNYQGKPYSYDKLLVNDLICIMPHPIPLRFSIPLKEDYDMTIRQLLHVGGVVRCEQFLCTFPHRDNKGGANTYRNDSTEGKATAALKAKWGPLVLDHRTRPGQVALNYKLIKEKREEILRLVGGGR